MTPAETAEWLDMKKLPETFHWLPGAFFHVVVLLENNYFL